jgi:hypothetical protein
MRKPGCSGDAVGRLLPRFALDIHRVLFAEPRFGAAVAGCAPLHCVVAPRPELDTWLFGRCSRPPPALARPQTSRWILLNLTAAPCPPARSLPPASPYSLPTGLTFLDLPSLPLESDPLQNRLVTSSRRHPSDPSRRSPGERYSLEAEGGGFRIRSCTSI